MEQEPNRLKSKYPFLLVHGMGFRDRKHLNYWGRIPKELQSCGYAVFHGNQDANGTTADNAAVLKERILQVLSETEYEKVNVIAHSKGGLDIRYMITQLDMGDKVASVTTISTPHHGSRTVDFLLKFPKPLVRFGCKITDGIMHLLGDQTPRTYEVIQQFCTEKAAAFNCATPDDSRVYYQSYAFVMKHWYSDMLLAFPYLIVYMKEGKSDGLLPPASVAWGEFRGVYTGNSKRGISHFDEVDLRRRRLTAKTGSQISDMTDFYIILAQELCEKGF